MQYVGQTKRTLKTRFKEHLFKIKTLRKLIRFFINISGKLVIHDLVKFWFNLWKNIIHKSNSTERLKNILRHELELKWIKCLQTPFPVGFNDNIYHEGITLKCRISMRKNDGKKWEF